MAFDPAVTSYADVDRLLRTEPQVQLTPFVLNNHSNSRKSHGRNRPAEVGRGGPHGPKSGRRLPPFYLASLAICGLVPCFVTCGALVLAIPFDLVRVYDLAATTESSHP